MTTSIDWAHEVRASLIWLSFAVLIGIVGVGVIGTFVVRTTRWGRQFWRLTRGFFLGGQRLRVWGTCFILLVLTLLAVRLNVLFSYQSNDMYTALQGIAEGLAGGDLALRDAAAAAFWSAIWVFVVLAVIHVARALVTYLFQSMLEIQWRTWLTEDLTADWLGDAAFYRNRFVGDANVDNPDQRIESDITNFVQTSSTLVLGAVSAVATIVSFTQVLWELSGPLTIFDVTIPRAMMWLVLVYVLITTVIAFWIGRPLIRLNFWNERLTANFRYALVRIRDGAENVAFYHGQGVERTGLLVRFSAIIKNFWQIVFRTLKFSGWNLGVNQTAIIVPLIVQAPRFISGEIALGALTQSASAFGNMHESLSFFRESYATFTSLRASLIRLDGLSDANQKSRELPTLATTDTDQGVRLADVDIQTPNGDELIRELNLSLQPGQALVVKGASGVGKTTLLRGLAGLWPFASGEFDRPGGNDTLFLSQIPYIPLGDLRTAVAYPLAPQEVTDDAIVAALAQVFLPHLASRLDEQQDWSKVLSPGEQQRIAFARILLVKPKAVFMDEATSAVDEGLEYELYSLIRRELPTSVIVSVSHRSTTDVHHTDLLEITAGGTWNVRALPAAPAG